MQAEKQANVHTSLQKQKASTKTKLHGRVSTRKQKRTTTDGKASSFSAGTGSCTPMRRAPAGASAGNSVDLSRAYLCVCGRGGGEQDQQNNLRQT
jgi:hypothetical protein